MCRKTLEANVRNCLILSIEKSRLGVERMMIINEVLDSMKNIPDYQDSFTSRDLKVILKKLERDGYIQGFLMNQRRHYKITFAGLEYCTRIYEPGTGKNIEEYLVEKFGKRQIGWADNGIEKLAPFYEGECCQICQEILENGIDARICHDCGMQISAGIVTGINKLEHTRWKYEQNY